MSTARTDWFTAGLEEAAEGLDPFDEAEELGNPIDLQDREAVLNARLVVTLKWEGNLYESGVTCPIKERSDTSCSACPVSEAAKRESPRSALCRLGREQEQIVTELAVLRLRRGGELD